MELVHCKLLYASVFVLEGISHTHTHTHRKGMFTYSREEM